MDYNITESTYKPMVYRIFFSLLYIGLTAISVIGNIFVILVILRVKNMLTPTNCYLISLALSDLLFFLSAAPVEMAFLHLPKAVYPFPITIVCKFLTYLPYLSINASSLTIAAFTIERYIGICHPLKARYVCTISRATKTVVFIWIFCSITNSPWLMLATLKSLPQNKSVCTFSLKRQDWKYEAIYMSDFIVFYFIPVVLLIILYGRIAMTLSKSFERKSTLAHLPGIAGIRSATDDRRQTGDRVQLAIMTGLILNGTPTATQLNGPRTRESRKRWQAIRLLFVIAFIFTICWLPYRAMVMYNSFATKPWHPEWYLLIAKTLVFINCSINPVLYNLMCERFRRAFSVFLQHLFLKRNHFSTDTTFGASRYYSVRSLTLEWQRRRSPQLLHTPETDRRCKSEQDHRNSASEGKREILTEETDRRCRSVQEYQNSSRNSSGQDLLTPEMDHRLSDYRSRNYSTFSSDESGKLDFPKPTLL